MPANDGFRPDNRNRAKDGREPAIEPNKQKTIGIVEVRPFRHPSSEHTDLLPQDQDFCFQPCSRLEERSQDAENQLEQILHQVANLPRLLSASMLNLIFGTHSRNPYSSEQGISRKEQGIFLCAVITACRLCRRFARSPHTDGGSIRFNCRDRSRSSKASRPKAHDR